MAEDANSEPLSISVIGETSEETYKGDFRFKLRLSHRDHLAKDQRRRELLGAQTGPATERALSTSMILAELFVRVIDAPAWFREADNGLDLVDDNVIGTLYDKIDERLKEKETQKKKAAKDAKKKLKEELKAELKAEGELPPDVE